MHSLEQDTDGDRHETSMYRPLINCCCDDCIEVLNSLDIRSMG